MKEEKILHTVDLVSLKSGSRSVIGVSGSSISEGCTYVRLVDVATGFVHSPWRDHGTTSRIPHPNLETGHRTSKFLNLPSISKFVLKHF